MDLLRTLCAWLCQAIYWLIAGLYDLFMNISRVELLTNDDIQPIYQRVTMILTIVMVFYVTFQAVKFVIQPDGFSDKEKGASKIVLKMVGVVLLIAFVPQIFSGAYWVQNKIFDNQVIPKVILGKSSVDSQQFGKNMAYNIMNMFYYTNEAAFTKNQLENENHCGYTFNKMPCKQIVSMTLHQLQTEGKLSLLTVGLNDKDKVVEKNTGKRVEEYYIEFNGLFAVGVGAFIAYMLLLYCIDAGVRVVQLLFLQIIAPIPIMGYLSPKKDGMFEKWTKQCLTTYLDLFLRVGIIYFVLLICEILGQSYMDGTLLGSGNSTINSSMSWLIYIALLMGLLMFAKKAPKMLGELFPKTGAASGNFGLSMKDRGFQGAGRIGGALAGTAVGAVIGAATGVGQGLRRMKKLDSSATAGQRARAGAWGAAKGLVGGIVGGASRGLVNGGKKGNMLKNVSAGAKNQIKANQRFGNREENGYSFANQVGDIARSAVGARSRVEMKETEKAPIKRQSDAISQIKKTNDNMRERAEKKLREGKGAQSQSFLAAEQKVKDLKENASVRAKYTVSKYQTKEEAYDAYVDAIKEARQSVNRQNFINPDGTFNSSAYEEACNRAANKVNQDEFKVSEYKTEQEAKDAYEKDLYEAQKELKTVKDMAIDDYINNEGDDAIKSMKETMDEHIKQYNLHASTDRKINVESIPTEAHEFDDYVKKTLKTQEDKNEREIIRIDADIEAIKRETSGSGINEGKKIQE